jgi:hypothetical protein
MALALWLLLSPLGQDATKSAQLCHVDQAPGPGLYEALLTASHVEV